MEGGGGIVHKGGRGNYKKKFAAAHFFELWVRIFYNIYLVHTRSLTGVTTSQSQLLLQLIYILIIGYINK